jgi:long-chain acyl-CoA synthetase
VRADGGHPGTVTDPELLTAADAADRGSAFAAWLAARGAGPGDRVALIVPGNTDLVAAALGALRAGVVPVMIDPATPEAERADLIEDAQPHAVLVDPLELAAAVRFDGAVATAPVPLGRPMHYTSGTTGRRKGVWSGLLAEPDAEHLWREEVELWRMTPADVHLVMSPLYHSAPLRFALATLLTGGSVLLPGRFAVTPFLAACTRFRPTTAFTAPAQLGRLREHATGGETAADAVLGALRGFRLLAHAGAPCPEPVKRWLLDHLEPDRVWEFYGSTEGQFTACSGTDWLARPGTVGRARPHRTLSTDDEGRIWCVVPDYARFTYWRDDAKTVSAWRETPAGPAFTVGDAGSLDADGYLTLHGRRDDLIISGGVNVYPAEVERVLAELPGIAEVAVFGVDDDRWGQRVEAVLRPAAGVTLDLDRIRALAAAHLPPARRPKRWHTVAELPRTTTGKILRRSLREMVAELNSAPVTPAQVTSESGIVRGPDVI